MQKNFVAAIETIIDLNLKVTDMITRKWFLSLSLVFAFSSLFADDVQETLIKQKTAGYIEAFNKHDPRALVSLFTENGHYVNPESGEEIIGRSALEESFKSRFQNAKGLQIDIKIGSIIFPTENEAIETGLIQAKQDGHEMREVAFKAYFEKQNGEWLIDEIRDIDIAAVPDQYQHLKELEWLIGDWVDEDEDVEIHTSYKWDTSKNFIFEKFTVVTEGKKELEGTQIIGWDPIQKKIRSWIFDTDGTFGESSWSKKDNSWVIESAQTLANGNRASAINVFTPTDSNSYTLESSGREVGGQILPDFGPITIKRKN